MTPALHTPAVSPTALAVRLNDGGRCDVLVVKRGGRILHDHTRSWAAKNPLAAELNTCRNWWIDELMVLGPEHPNYLPLLSLIREMESARVDARERGL